MGTNKERTPESNNKGNYETTVLDFLDREMAAIQPDKKQKESGQEVDELVTDLLKQVITESDEPSAEVQTVSNSLETVLAEDPPLEIPPIEEKKEALPSAEKLEPAEKTASSAEEDKKDDSREKPSQESSENELFRPRIPDLALGMAPRRKFPLMAVASVCLVVAIGVAVLYLWGSSRKDSNATEFLPAAVGPVAPENANMDVLNTLQQPNAAEPEILFPSGKNAVSQQNPPQSNRKAPSAGSSDSVSATPVQKSAAPKPKSVTPAAVNAESETEPDLPTVEFLTAQISAPSPLTTASNLNIDRSALPPMPDGIALANSALDRNPGLTSQPQASGPAGSRNLVPSILISQVNPVYPELAIRSRTSGSVVLELQIDNEGKVVKATPVSGPSVFYIEAVKAAMQYRYRPATLNGRNVSSKSRVTMIFNYNR